MKQQKDNEATYKNGGKVNADWNSERKHRKDRLLLKYLYTLSIAQIMKW